MIPNEHFATYEIDGELYIVDTGRHSLYHFEGLTRNPRVVALADAAAWNGTLDTVHVDGVEIILQHHLAGIEKRLLAYEWLDDPLPVFTEPKERYAGEVAEIVTERYLERGTA